MPPINFKALFQMLEIFSNESVYVIIAQAFPAKTMPERTHLIKKFQKYIYKFSTAGKITIEAMYAFMDSLDIDHEAAFNEYLTGKYNNYQK